MSDDILREQMQNLKKLSEIETKLARMEGEARGSVTAALGADEVLQNNLRALAWKRADPDLVLTMKGDAVVGMPNGWPDSVPNPEEHVAEFVRKGVSAGLEKTFGGSKRTVEREVEDSPSVRRLLEITQ
ncbi:MAG: hypothetical protein AAFY34_09250 [Pseudomonadota bacterium]